MLAELKFNATTHIYTLGGRVLPSVTQALQVLDQYENVPARTLEAARVLGVHVHLACELWDRGTLDESALDMNLRPYLDGWRKFRGDTGFVPTHIEERVLHRQYRYAGTVDRMGMLRNRPALIDIKSGMKPKSVGAQTAAYAAAWCYANSYNRALSRYCVQLMPGDYRLHALDDPADFPLFLSCLNVHTWRSRNAA